MKQLDASTHRPRLRAALAVVATAALAGCGAGEAEPLYPVAGRVTLNGKGLPVGSVTFKPDGAKGNKSQHNPVADISPGGAFELYTTGKKGAPPGWYKVLVFADENIHTSKGGVHPAAPKWMVHMKYTDDRTTDLYVEVVESPAPGRYELTVSK